MPRSIIKPACLAAATLLPMAAQGSFGGAPCRDDFGCHFITWGVLLGVVNVPVSATIFAVLRAGLCHRARSRVRELLVGALVGVVAYEVSVAAGALLGASGKAPPGRETDYLLMGFVAVYVTLAIVSILHARTPGRNGGDGRPPSSVAGRPDGGTR
jgi:hypothetical protein